MSAVPATVLLPALGVLGLFVGSFLNVVVHRVPDGLSVVRPGSACPSCSHPVRAYDNVPVLSWLVLRGRCRDCGARISPRYPLVEGGTALLFAATAAWIGYQWHLPAFGYLAAVSICLTLIDVDVRRLPDAIVLPSYVVGGALLLAASLAERDLESAVRAAAGTAAMFGAYFAMAFAHPAGMGFGDVKLAGVLGMYLGWLGWAELAVGFFAAFVVGGVAGLLLVAVSGGGRKTTIPFGPFMLVGAYVGIAAGERLAAAYLGLTGL